MKAKVIVAVVFGAICELASAARDPRIRVEQYDPDQVVEIYTAVGNPTLIQFEADEEIKNTRTGMISMGDSKAWKAAPRANNIMLLPKAKLPDTKMVVVTTKRSYAFEIISASAKNGTKPTLILRFDYPDTKARLAKAEAGKLDAVSERLQEIAKAGGKAASTQGRNRKFMKQGDEALVPSEVEDDGRFTYFRFDSTRELPLVYKVLPDGKEAQVEFHVESDTGIVVVHDTAAMFRLRYGQAVLAIRNDGYNPDALLNLTGSTVPRTLRLLKEHQ